MKILHITDSHGTVKSPESRTDLFYLTFLRKLAEITYIVKLQKIDMVLHTGDLFHLSRVSNKFMGQVAEIIKSWGVPVYVVPGNHDIDGYTIDTIDQTSLGLLAKTGILTLLTRDNPIRINTTQSNKTFTIAISGQEYYANIDTGDMSDFEMQQDEADINILAIHGYIADTPQHPNIRCTYPKDIITDADIILCGHYHRSFAMDVGDVSYYNPGSMMRVEMTEYNKTHMPQYGILEIELDKQGYVVYDYNFHQFRIAKPSSAVFDFNSAGIIKKHGITLENFKTSIANTMQNINVNTGVSPLDTIKNTVNEYCNAKSYDVNYIQKMISKSESIYNNASAMVTDDDAIATKGFIPANIPVKVKSIDIENFQSHENTHIDFDAGLNIIVGESNNGKCVRGDSYIKTESGLRQIKDLFTETLIEDTFYNTDESVIVTGQTEKLGALYYSGYKKSVLFSLADGRELECSYEEPLLVWNSEKFCEEFKKACDLTTNDLLIRDVRPIIIDKSDNNLQKIDWSYDKTVYANYLLQHENISNVNELQNKVDFSHASAYRNFYHRNKFNISLPKYLNADLAYIVGLIDGDGCISKGNYCTCNEFLKNEYTRIIKENFNEDVEFTERKGLLYTKGANGTFPLIVKGIMKAKGQNANTKKVPQIIKMSPWYIQLEYVKGIMDTDGSIDKTGRLELSMNSKDIVLFVKEFTESIGYNGTLTKRGKSWRYQFSHSRFSTNHESLFRLPRKKDREIQKEKLTGLNKEILKGSAKWFKSQNISFTREQRKQITGHTILDYNVRDITVSAYNTFISKADKLGIHIERRIPEYHTVCSINSIKENVCDLYDVTNPISHTFTANGFIVHNTSLLRAMDWVVDNQPLGTDFIMTGKKYCKVRITYDNDNFIERYRTLKDTGYYHVGFVDNSGQDTYIEYKGFTNNVPVEVMNVHQMPKINITKNIETHLNKLSQLERPFLITENTNEKAAAIGRITGTNIVDVAIKNIGSNITADKKLLKANIKTKTELEAQKDLIDINKLESLKTFYESALSKIKKLQDLYNSANNIKLTKENCDNNIVQYIKTIDDCQTIIKKKKEIDEAQELITNINTMMNLLNKYKQCNESIKDLNTKINDCNKTIIQKNTINSCDNAISKIQSLMILLKKQASVNGLIDSQKYAINHFTKIISQTKDYEEKETQIEMIRKMMNLYKRNQVIQLNIQENSDDSSCILTMIGNLNSELEEHQNAMKEYVLSNKICPCCGQKITDKNVYSIINNFSKEG